MSEKKLLFEISVMKFLTYFQTFSREFSSNISKWLFFLFELWMDRSNKHGNGLLSKQKQHFLLKLERKKMIMEMFLNKKNS